MRKTTEYLHSDSWVLLAIIYSGAQKGALLEEVIAVGDYINHAIFCFEELEGALARLSTGKYIRRKGKFFFPTEKTMNFWREVHKKRSYVHKDWERIAQFIHAKPWEKGSTPQKVNEGYSYKWINRELFQQAVDKYLGKEELN